MANQFSAYLQQFANVWERIVDRCVWDGECFVWQGGTQSDGYGSITVKGRKVLVHRTVYEYFNGPIPAGLQIDHVKARGCRFRACCNLAHLEVVTSRENSLRGATLAAACAARTHCPKGHELTADNVVKYHLRAAGKRKCLICAREHSRAWYYRQKGAA